MTKNRMPTPRSVMVTGASSGIGRACAIHLGRLGFQVFAGVRKQADGDALKLWATGPLVPVLIDITEPVSLANAVHTVEAFLGEAGLNGLVNNAGIVVAGPLEFLPMEELRKQLEVNVIGQIAVTQAFLPLLRKGAGRVVNMGSIRGKVPLPFLGPYCASKFALEALTDSLRMELRQWGIQMVIVEPGSVATPIWEKSRAAAEKVIARLPQRAQHQYSPAFEAVRKATDKMSKFAMDADVVAKTVARALTANRPKPRYLVGRDARLEVALAKLLPRLVNDWVIARLLRLPRPDSFFASEHARREMSYNADSRRE